MSVDELISERFSPQDHSKARKSLVASSILAIFASSIEITSDEFSLFVFSVRVEQQTLIATGQIVTLILLAIFLIRVFPEYLQRHKAYSLKKIDLLAKIERNGIYEDYYVQHDDYDGSPSSEIKWVEEKWKDQKLKRESTLDRIALTYDAFANTTLNLVTPILLSTIAIFNPELPKSIALAVFADQTGVVEILDEAQTGISQENP